MGLIANTIVYDKFANTIVYDKFANTIVYDNLLLIPFILFIITRDWKIPLALAIFLVYFLYSPEKKNPLRDPSIFYSPSDGYVRDIIIQDEFITISLFLDLFSNHTQYVPMDSVLVSTAHLGNLFEPAYLEHAINNRRVINTFRTPSFEYTITQITGILTRRILTLAPLQKELVTGERFGFIVLGSRVDIKVPRRHINAILIKIGQKINAMEPIIKLQLD